MIRPLILVIPTFLLGCLFVHEPQELYYEGHKAGWAIGRHLGTRWTESRFTADKDAALDELIYKGSTEFDSYLFQHGYRNGLIDGWHYATGWSPDPRWSVTPN